MRVSMKEFRNLVSNVLLEDIGMYRCADGKIVPEESEACLPELDGRIEDATYHRDICSLVSDERLHLNGLLKGLRKKRRRLTKSLAPVVDSSLDA